MFSPSWINQLIEDGKAPPPEGGLWGTNESTPVALWPDPDDGSKADLARAVPKERVSGPFAKLCSTKLWAFKCYLQKTLSNSFQYLLIQI